MKKIPPKIKDETNIQEKLFKKKEKKMKKKITHALTKTNAQNHLPCVNNKH